jgi:purine-nucleoside phosphorylase
LQLIGKPLPPVKDAVVTHEEVLEVGKRKAELMRELIETVVPLV